MMQNLRCRKFTGTILLLILTNFLVLSQEIKLNVEKYILTNGLTVFLYPDKNAKDVYGAVYVKAGSKYDPKDATGMGHYLEHMLFKGTDKIGTLNYTEEKKLLDGITTLYDNLDITVNTDERKILQDIINQLSIKAGEYAIPNEFDMLSRGIGTSDLNAYTSSERIVFHSSVPEHQLDKWLLLNSERFINPVWRLFQSELEAVYEEKNQSMDNYQTFLYEVFNSNFYKNHPYRQPAIGYTEHLKNPSLTKMTDYYNKYFVAGNMALILSGNFDSEKIKTMIEKTFSRLKKDNTDVFPVYKEDDFKGRVEVNVSFTPTLAGLLGYRTVSNKDDDIYVFQIIDYMLSNSNECGLFDKLMLDNKFLYLYSSNVIKNDLGCFVIGYSPKPPMGTLIDGEKVVLKELEKIKQGNFQSDLLDMAKNNLILEFEKSFEKNEQIASIIGSYFIEDKDIKNYVKYPDKINSITKKDIMRVAAKYFGKNYLVINSKVGTPEKEKLEKPGFQPIAQKSKVESNFALNFNKITVNNPAYEYIDFNKDINLSDLKKGYKIYYTKNPVNNIFNLTISFNYGKYYDRLLLWDYLNYCGTAKMQVNDLKLKMAMLGCNYNFFSGNDKTGFEIEGLEKNLIPALRLINDLINNAKSDKSSWDRLLNDVYTQRKQEKANSGSIAGSLSNYVIYKNNSNDLITDKLSDLKKLDPEKIISAYKKAFTYEGMIAFVGKTPLDDVKKIIDTNFKLSDNPNKSVDKVIIPKVSYPENTIFFVDRKDAVQSKVYFYILSEQNKPLDLPLSYSINSYIGGMDGVFFQEVRELRSLAYSVSGWYSLGVMPGDKGNFGAYVATQGDKTIESIKVITDLINNMPFKKEKEVFLKESLLQEIYSINPGFREVNGWVDNLMKKGYKEDPRKTLADYLKNMNIDELKAFYDKYVKDRPIAIAIVGDKTKIDMKKLETYGKIIYLSEDDFYNN